MSGLPDLDFNTTDDDDVDALLRVVGIDSASDERPSIPKQHYAPHPIAECWPMLSDAEHREMCTSFKALGQLQPITLYQGKILDGRNRYRVCLELGIEPRFIEYTGDDPVGYALAMNNMRRHLDTSQRSIIAANVSGLKVGGDGRNQHGVRVAQSCATLTQAEAAEKFGVSRRSVQMARKLLNEAPELAEDVKAGRMSVTAAVKKLSKSEPQRDDGGDDDELDDDIGGEAAAASAASKLSAVRVLSVTAGATKLVMHPMVAASMIRSAITELRGAIGRLRPLSSGEHQRELTEDERRYIAAVVAADDVFAAVAGDQNSEQFR